MKVGLFIDTDNYGGAEAVVISIVRSLADSGHEPVIYHFGNPYLESVAEEIGVDHRVVTHHRLYKRTYRLPVFAFHFARMLAADRIDVLNSHLFGPIIAGGLTCWWARLPHVGTLHDVYIVEERPLRAKLLRIVYALGTRLVCVSEQMADYYASVTGIARDALRVIRNGVDLDRYGPPDGLRGDSAAVRLIMVGRLDPIKRHDLLLETLPGLKSLPDWQVLIVGDGPELDRLRELRQRLALEDRVEFLGQRDDVPALLGGADVFLLISDSEGMSLSLIEAIASALPIVATDVGNNSEFVRDGWNGYLIRKGDTRQLEDALIALMSSADARRQFGLNSRQLAAGVDLRRTLSSYLDLYEEAAATA